MRVTPALAALAGAGLGAWAVWEPQPAWPCALAVAALGVGLVLCKRRALGRHGRRLEICAVLASAHCMAVDWGPVNPLNVLIALLMAHWLFDRLARSREPTSPTVFAALVGVFWAAALLSIAGDPRSVGGLLVLTPKLILALLILDRWVEPPRVRCAIAALIYGSALSAAVGIAQALLYYGWQIEFSPVLTSGDRFMVGGSAVLLRATGLGVTAQSFAQPLMVAAVVGLYLLGARSVRTLRRGPLVLAVLAAVGGLGLSFARGQWLGFAAGLAAMPFVAQPRRAPRWLGAAVLALGIGLGSGLLQHALAAAFALSPDSLGVRGVLAGAGLRALLQHPGSGVGIQGFGPFSPTVDRWPVHNALLQAGSELGLPGLLALAAVLGWVGVRLAAALSAAREPRARAELGALLCGYVALAVAIQADPMAYSEFVWIYLALAEAAARANLPAPVGGAARAGAWARSAGLGSLRPRRAAG